MNPYYRIEALTHYPDWHKQPLRLTIPEIENPHLVLKDFFSIYHLTGIRRILEQLFESTLASDDEDKRSFYFDISNLHRLNEAAWLLHKQKQEQFQHEKETGDNTTLNEEPANKRGSTFQKPLRLMDRIANEPLQSLHEVFSSIGIKELKSIVSNWLNIALTTNTEPYYTATERAGVMAFCIQLKYLIEAGYIISRSAKIQEQRGMDVASYYQLPVQLFSKEGIEDLNEEEIEQPYNIVKDFFSRFSLLHCRAELWDLFAATINTNNNSNINKTVLLTNYQRLYTLIEALWFLQNKKANETKEQNSEASNTC